MGAYDSAADSALRLITAKGAAVPIRRTVETLADPVTQTRVTSTATHTMQAVGLPPGRSASYRIGTLEGRKLLELHIAQNGLAIEPLPGDVVTWAGAEWTVFWADTYKPDGVSAVYTLAYAER